MIELIIFSSLASLGVYLFTQEGEPLHFITKANFLYYKGNPRKIFYPVIHCPKCMGWFFFICFYLFTYEAATLKELVLVPFAAIGTSFLNYILSSFIE